MKITEVVVAWFGGVIFGLNAMLFIFPEEMGAFAAYLLVLGLFSAIGTLITGTIVIMLDTFEFLDL